METRETTGGSPASTSTDRIEKRIVLRAPRSRVWRALTDAEEFGTWFGFRMATPFAPGARVHGKVTTPGYEHLSFEMFVERMEPERLFSWRWHPGAVEPEVDYSPEPMTLVEIQLEEVPEGTRLTVVETGFDALPASRRASAFRMNEEGWAIQLKNVERHVSPH
jgi:uncharacterized protein YndB with AHSA1/START domain